MIEFLLNKWIVLIIGFLFMFMGLNSDWTMWVVRQVGKMGWAEQRMGRGSTFDVWKIIGILAPIIAIIYFFSGGVKFDEKKTQGQYDPYSSYDPY